MAKLDMLKYLSPKGIVIHADSNVRAVFEGRARRFIDVEDEKIPGMLKANLIHPTEKAGVYILSQEGWEIFANEMLKLQDVQATPVDGKHRLH